MAAVTAAVAVVIVLFIPSMRRATLATPSVTAQEPLVLPSTGGGAGTEEVVGGRVVLGTSERMRRNTVVSIVTVEGEPIDWARADNEGRYRIALPGPGRYVAIANAQGWTPASRVFDFGGGSSSVDVLLAVPLAITGVVTTDTVGYEGALVVLTRSGGEYVATTVSGSDGDYNFPLPPQGSYVVTVVDIDGVGAVSRSAPSPPNPSRSTSTSVPISTLKATHDHAAASLFAQRTYGDTTVRDIAELAEVSPALVIKHFRSKGELCFEVGPNTERLADLELLRDVLAHAFVKQIFDRHDHGLTEPWIDNLMAIRQSPVPEETRNAIRDRIVGRIADLIGDATSDRVHAQAVAATVIGIAHAVRELGLFDKEETERVLGVQYLSALIQTSIDTCRALA